MTIYGNLDFVDLKYIPKRTDVLLEYRAEPTKGTSLQQLAEYLAGESSIGTWTKINTMNPSIAKRLKPHVFEINKRTNTIRIAYPEELFELGNMPGFLSSIAGNIYGMKEAKHLRLQDINFTKKLVDSFPGPQFGIAGVRKIAKIPKGPLLGTIVKPKVGLTEAQHAQVAYESWVGGLDIVKDDENLCSMSYNNFDKRMVLTFKARDKAEKETGKKKIYLANITSQYDEMERRARLVKKLGGEFIMVDVLTVGWSGLQGIRKLAGKLKLAIHAHRAMHGALTRDPKHGISMLALAKTYRLCGVDTLHIGTANVGKMEGAPDEVLAIEQEIEGKHIAQDKHLHVLRQDWYNVKPVLAVASGGLSPLSTPKVIKIMGEDTVIQYGGGCHGHPDKSRAGATAIRQSLEASTKGISLTQYAKTHLELARALEKWGPKSSRRTENPRKK